MLSEKIYTLRRTSGLSQEQLAEKIGVSRQAVSKWEGGLSTPELDKLKALSELFHISIDELTSEHAANGSSADADSEKNALPVERSKETKWKIGVCLCLTGAACLILLGILVISQPVSAARLNESSMITLNGTGILTILFLLLMGIGMALILKKK